MKKILCMAAVLALAGTGMAGAFGGIMDTEAGYGTTVLPTAFTAPISK